MNNGKRRTLLQHLQLLLVGVVERLGRVLRLVHGCVRLGLEDQLEPLPHAGHVALPSLLAALPPLDRKA